MKETRPVPQHGREARFASCEARREKRAVVIPLERRATTRRTCKGASHSGLVAQTRTALLRALPMTTGIRRSPRLAAESVRPKRGSWGGTG